MVFLFKKYLVIFVIDCTLVILLFSSLCYVSNIAVLALCQNYSYSYLELHWLKLFEKIKQFLVLLPFHLFVRKTKSDIFDREFVSKESYVQSFEIRKFIIKVCKTSIAESKQKLGLHKFYYLNSHARKTAQKIIVKVSSN